MPASPDAASAGAARPDELCVDTLLARVGDGDAEAFSALYDALAAGVFGVAAGVTRSRELAEEVTQDVFVWVWRSARSFDPGRGSAVALIHTVTRRRAVDAVRREATARRKALVLQEAGPGPASTYDLGSGLEDTDELETLLDRLTDLQREAVRLTYWEGLTGAELAERLGVNLATAKTRRRDGLLRLRWAAADLALG